MKNIKLDISCVTDFASCDELHLLQYEINRHHRALLQKTGKGNEFLGWVNLPSSINSGLIKKIETDAKRIRDISEVFVVIGIGGSYLGARAVIDALSNPFGAFYSQKKNPYILYAGNNISEEAVQRAVELSTTKYCPAQSMLSKVVPIKQKITIQQI